MKRIGHIIISLALSLLIVYLSVGASLVHCNCSGKTHIVNPLDINNLTKNDASGCMEVTIEKITNLQQASSFLSDFTASWTIVDAYCFLPMVIQPLYINIQDRPILNPIPLPPRLYLSKIQVLLL